MKIRVFIPARLESSRFPKKLLQKVSDITLIEHICLRAKKIKSDSLAVLTDSRHIQEIVESHNIECHYSKVVYSNGTDRIAHYCELKKYNASDLIINIQADEFNFPLRAIEKIKRYFMDFKEATVATLTFRIINPTNLDDKNLVKVVKDKNDNAIYFSRSAIPFNSRSCYGHLGIYAYKVRILAKYRKLKKGMVETEESLEQNRFLYNSVPIKCISIKSHDSISINTKNDLKLAKKKLKWKRK